MLCTTAGRTYPKLGNIALGELYIRIRWVDEHVSVSRADGTIALYNQLDQYMLSLICHVNTYPGPRPWDRPMVETQSRCMRKRHSGRTHYLIWLAMYGGN
jgi:hypothetical protein